MCCRGWILDTIPTQQDSTTCTVLYRQKLKPGLLNPPPAAPMAFFGWQGNTACICMHSLHRIEITCMQCLVGYMHAIVRSKLDSCIDWFRAMDFIVELFRNLGEHRDWSMSQACTDSYSKTLKKWHGWLASSSFMVCNSFLYIQYIKHKCVI